MAEFVADSPYREYRIRCLVYFEEIHGKEYADAVKQEVEFIFKKRKKK